MLPSLEDGREHTCLDQAHAHVQPHGVDVWMKCSGAHGSHALGDWQCSEPHSASAQLHSSLPHRRHGERCNRMHRSHVTIIHRNRCVRAHSPVKYSAGCPLRAAVHCAFLLPSKSLLRPFLRLVRSAHRCAFCMFISLVSHHLVPRPHQRHCPKASHLLASSFCCSLAPPVICLPQQCVAHLSFFVRCVHQEDPAFHLLCRPAMHSLVMCSSTPSHQCIAYAKWMLPPLRLHTCSHCLLPTGRCFHAFIATLRKRQHTDTTLAMWPVPI